MPYKEIMEKRPWLRSYYSAYTRCHLRGGRYFKRGIKFFMKIQDFKYLWFRDKAYLMKHPTIDRIDNDGDYTLKNCRYLEQRENWGRGKNRLVAEQVIKIKKEYKKNKYGYGYKALAKKYGVHYNAIQDIIRGNTWKDI